MESIAEDTPALRRWFNIEPVADKGALQELLDRVGGTGYEALLVNVDCRAIGHRERDYRNGFTAPPTLRIGSDSRRGRCGSSVVLPVWANTHCEHASRR